MTERATLAAYMHVEGFENFHRESFDKKKLRAAFRKAGRLVQNRARLLAVAGSNYPQKRTGVLRNSIKMRVSRSGFMVKVMPAKTAGMKEYYPAFLHYGVKKKTVSKGKKNARTSNTQTGGWRIKPRSNYMADALEDESGRVRAILSAGLAAALG